MPPVCPAYSLCNPKAKLHEPDQNNERRTLANLLRGVYASERSQLQQASKIVGSGNGRHRDDLWRAVGEQCRKAPQISSVPPRPFHLPAHCPNSTIISEGTHPSRSKNDALALVLTVYRLPLHIDYTWTGSG